MAEDFEKEMEEIADEAMGVRKHNEAPASVNMKAWIDGYGFMFTIRSGATKKEVTDLVDKATKLVELAKLGGWKTDWNDTPAKTPSVTAPEPPQSRPTEAYCQEHNKAMTLRHGKYGDFWSCSTKLPDGSWCKSVFTEM